MYAMLTGKLPYTAEPFHITALYNKMKNNEMNPLPEHLSAGKWICLPLYVSEVNKTLQCSNIQQICYGAVCVTGQLLNRWLYPGFAQFVFSATRRWGYFGSNFSRLVTETPCHDFILSRCVVVGIPCSTPRLALYNIEWSRMNDNRVFRCVWCYPLLLVTEINVAEYGLCCKQREVLVDKSHRNSREIIPWRSSPTVSIFRHIYFCLERTMMTSENTIFVRFHFTLCYLMLTQLFGYQPQKLDSVWILRASFIIVIRA